MKKAHKYITIGILLLLIYSFAGCSMARMRAVVITKDAAVYGTIPKEIYKVKNMEGKIENVTFKEDWYIVNDAALVKVEEIKNKRFFRGIKLTNRNKIVGSSLLFILGILYRIMALKKKSDKGEEIKWTDIINVFKKPVKKKK